MRNKAAVIAACFFVIKSYPLQIIGVSNRKGEE
jgi:hypothetical protein